MSKIQSLKSVSGKETIYVDVDDEITSIIDKIQMAKGKVVALVLPKRAPVLQSVVNMKLLKRTAENAEKNLVLVTSEAGLMPLAGAVGLHVASTPTSKPAVPSAPAGPGDEPEEVDAPLDIVDGTDAGTAPDFDPKAASATSVGELAGVRASKKASDSSDVDESIDMSEDEEPSEDEGGAAPLPKPKKNGRLSIPNFDSFRKKLALGVLGVVLVVTGWVYAFMIAPKVTVTIKSDTSTVTTNLNLVLDTAAKQLDTANNIVPATSGSQQKTATEQVPATGTQNNGEKAVGKVRLSISKCAPNLGTPDNLPAGSSVTAGGHSYITQDTTVYNFDDAHGSCVTYKGVADTTIKAFKGGEDYNTDNNTTFTSSTGASGKGSAKGGTDDIIKIVQQSDIDGAAKKISESNTTTIKDQLIANLKSKGLQPVPTTFLAGQPAVTTSAKAGDTADNVTVTAVTTYTMLGVQKSDLVKLVTRNVNDHIDKTRQVITDDGVTKAVFDQADPGSDTGANVAMETKSVAGPNLDVKTLKKQIAGQKSATIKNSLKEIPGVEEVDVHFSPFWVNVAPKNVDKITVIIVKKDA